MSTRPACRIEPPVQISTGQAGKEINRDLENLFKTMRDVARCVGKIAGFLNQGNDGGFDDGGGGGDSGSGGSGGSGSGGGTGGGGIGTDPVVEPAAQFYSTGSNITVPAMTSGIYKVVPSANIDVTLPAPTGCGTILIIHGGSANTATVKDDLGNTLCVLAAGQLTYIAPRQGATSSLWPTKSVKVTATGQVITPSVYVNATSPGLILADGSGSYWRLDVSGAGVLSTTSVVTPES